MEKVMSEIATYLSSKNNIQVHLVLYGITRSIFFSVPDSVIIHKPLFKFKNSLRFLNTLRTIIFLRKTIKDIYPLTILSFGEYWNNFVLLSLYGLDFPVFVSDRSQPNKSLGYLHDSLRHWLYPKAEGLIMQTEKAKEIYLKKNKHNNIAVIGNPIKVSQDEMSNDLRKNNVLMVGRLITTKHQDRLIRIFATINKPEWRLVLVGYDHLKQKNLDGLKILAKNLGIEDRVIFAGKQEDVQKIYSYSSIFAFTSSSEGFPNAIGEAMANGLPVIAYDCIAGPSEMVQDGFNGFLIPLFDDRLFKSKLSLLMEDEDLRKHFGANAKSSIKRFTNETICEKIYQFTTDL
jgi:glycosyltransferase involved in cell wall biosynthesis